MFLWKGYIAVWSEISLWSRKQKLLCHGYVISDLNGEMKVGTFYEKELQKTSYKEFRIEKTIKRKGDSLYVKLKRCDNSFNSWNDMKDIV